MIQEHINYNTSSIISNFPKSTNQKDKKLDSSLSLNNVHSTISNFRDSQCQVPSINSLKKSMRDGRNIVVPRITQAQKFDFNSSSKYKDYISSYFNAKVAAKTKPANLPPIKQTPNHKNLGISFAYILTLN